MEGKKPGVWGVSYWRIKYRTKRAQFAVWSGKVNYIRFRADSQALTNYKKYPRGWNVWGLRPRGRRFSSTFWTLRLFRNPFGLEIPLWMPTLLFGLWPAWLLLPFHRRRKRKNLGLCLKCGYDLRGSEGRCPECGMLIEQPLSVGP